MTGGYDTLKDLVYHKHTPCTGVHTLTYTDLALNTHCNTWCPAGAVRPPSPALLPSGSTSVPAHSSEVTNTQLSNGCSDFSMSDTLVYEVLILIANYQTTLLRFKFHLTFNLILFLVPKTVAARLATQSKLQIKMGLRGCILNLDICNV